MKPDMTSPKEITLPPIFVDALLDLLLPFRKVLSLGDDSEVDVVHHGRLPPQAAGQLDLLAEVLRLRQEVVRDLLRELRVEVLLVGQSSHLICESRHSLGTLSCLTLRMNGPRSFRSSVTS